MNKIKAGDPVTQSEDVVRENIKTLKSIFPTIVKEGKIDFEELKALLGEEIETNEEYYRFTWAGKSMARREANKPTTATLRPNKKDSKDWDTTGNVFIEGDNLEVLKLLQKSYADRIKMIYIDPPYNTGKDFVYKDNYADNLGNYLAVTGQTDEQGKKINTNTESDGRYHSNWLNMMYPRLKLSRTLLHDSGVIFISIDDNEVQNLRKLCDEIYGEENFISNVIWQRTFASKNDAKYFSSEHEHLLVYCKDIQFVNIQLLERTEKHDARYSNPDLDERGVWTSTDLLRMEHRDNSVYEITSPSGKVWKPQPGTSWRHPEDEMLELIKNNEVTFGVDGKSKPRRKRFLKDVKQGIVPQTIWKHEDVGHTQEAKQALNRIFDGISLFDNPKPSKLIQRCLQIITTSEGEDIVLDFFAGTGTTGQAVMEFNKKDNGNRKYLLVQLPEPTAADSDAFKAGYSFISEITKERLRRVGEKIKAEWLEENRKSLGKLDFGESSKNDIVFDSGFKAFKLDSSNIKAWDGNPDNFEHTLFNSATNIKEGRTEEDVLFEILLKNGLDLTLPIEEKAIAGKRVFNIGAGALFICLADNITTSVADGIGSWKDSLNPSTCKVIFKDNGFTDVEKTNSIQILKRYGISDVNSI